MAESLTDRLDDLMVRLHQEGRDEDTAIVLEAIRALTPAEPREPALWAKPLKGDACRRPDGKARTVLRATYIRYWGNGPNIAEQPAGGYYPDRVRYTDEKGREHYVSASSWATWCRAARKAGGTYDRAPEAAG